MKQPARYTAGSIVITTRCLDLGEVGEKRVPAGSIGKVMVIGEIKLGWGRVYDVMFDNDVGVERILECWIEHHSPLGVLIARVNET